MNRSACSISFIILHAGELFYGQLPVPTEVIRHARSHIFERAGPFPQPTSQICIWFGPVSVSEALTACNSKSSQTNLNKRHIVYHSCKNQKRRGTGKLRLNAKPAAKVAASVSVAWTIISAGQRIEKLKEKRHQVPSWTISYRRRRPYHTDAHSRDRPAINK